MNDAWFFVGVFAFIFLIWIATGGPMRPLPYTGPTLPEPQELGGGTYLSFPRAPFGVGGSYISLPGSSEGGPPVGGQSYGSYGFEVSPETVPLYGIVFGTPSPLRGSIELAHAVTNASSTKPREEYLSVFVPQSGTAVNVTGWKVVSEVTGKSATLTRGTMVPVSGRVNQTADIVLQPGERAHIITGVSPLGVSFRENKCIGYLSTFQSYTPPLPHSCPDPEDELAKFYGPYYIRDTVCVDYVNTFGTCQSVPSARSRFEGEDVTPACKSFITEYLNYNGCVRAHRSDADFHGDTWYIYLGQQKYLWRDRHEVVKLLDAQLRTIDAFAY